MKQIVDINLSRLRQLAKIESKTEVIKLRIFIDEECIINYKKEESE